MYQLLVFYYIYAEIHHYISSKGHSNITYKIKTLGLFQVNRSSNEYWPNLTCTTCCKPLLCPPLSGCWSCCSWYICVCFPGVSLLVPHGAVAENMSWEMYMVINQGEARWGQSLLKCHIEHLSVCQSPSILSPICPASPSSVLARLPLSNYLPSSVTFITAAGFSQ